MLKPTPRNTALLVGLWLAVATIYVFVVSAGHFISWHTWSALYDGQAEGLLHGHFYLPEAPSRALMALANPYDVKNMPSWRWDHIYYKGHLYLYWGMVPAALTAAAKALFRVRVIPDDVIVFGFFMLRLVAGTLLIRDVARSLARPPPAWMVVLGMLVFALANPTPYTLARGAVYEAAIVGGSAFVVTGLACGYRSMAAQRTGAATAWLAAASFSFGLAGGSRISLLPTVTALAVLAGFWRWRLGRQYSVDAHRRLIGLGVAALVPVGAVILSLLVINKLRFGDWTEFGRNYMMTYPYFVPGARFVLPNSYAYFFAPPTVSCAFPYLSAGWQTLRASTPAWLPLVWPRDLQSAEPSVGLLVVVPFTWFALAALPAAIGRALERCTRPGRSDSPWDAIYTRLNWLWVALAIYIAGALPLLILNAETMRYQHDFDAGVLLISIFTGWRLVAAASRPGARRALSWLYGVLAVSTIVAGLLLGFGGYFKNFERYNPTLLHKLQATLSVCGG